MKTAKEMFEELGYKLTYENYCRIRYYNSDLDKYLSFKKFNETITIYPNIYNISVSLIKAINKQCEELEWK